MENYSLSNACIDILKTSKNATESEDRIFREVLANIGYFCAKSAYDIVIDVRNDIKQLIKNEALLINQNERNNELLAKQIKNQQELLKLFKEYIDGKNMKRGK